MNNTIVTTAGGFAVIPEGDAKKDGIYDPDQTLPLPPSGVARSHLKLDEGTGLAVRPNNDG